MKNYHIFVDGIESLKDFDNLPEKVERAAYRAINATAAWARTRAREEILRQVSFPRSYLDPSQGRLTVARQASLGSLRAEIWARRRATSLARFIKSGKPPKVGARVEVKPGKSQHMKRAFVMTLKSGAANLDTKANFGLAVRTKDGQKPTSAYKPVRVSTNLWLLYGPSVDQVFRGVAPGMEGDVSRYLNQEFNRLLEADF